MQARVRASQPASAARAGAATGAAREPRLLSLQRLAGNQACFALQRKVATRDKTVAKEAELGLAGGKSASPVVRRLLSAPEEYYLPDTPAPDFEAVSVRALKASKYILGEAHGDGAWEARTGPWKY